MVTALQTTLLSWDLAAQQEYQAGSELQLTIGFTAPESGRYYLLGALFTSNLDYIEDTLFGVLVPEGLSYAVNHPQQTSLFDLVASESVELGGKFIFDQTDVVVGLFLLKMFGEAPSLADDEELGSLSTQLVSPASGFDISQMMGLLAAVVMIGVVMGVVSKDEE